MLHLRLHEEELQELRDRADMLGCTVAEVVRAHLFGRSVQAVVPCSRAPHNCNPQHRDMVHGYRDQRYRDELAREERTGNHPGDLAHEKAKGLHPMTTFNEWLKAYRR